MRHLPVTRGIDVALSYGNAYIRQHQLSPHSHPHQYWDSMTTSTTAASVTSTSVGTHYTHSQQTQQYSVYSQQILVDISVYLGNIISVSASS